MKKVLLVCLLLVLLVTACLGALMAFVNSKPEKAYHLGQIVGRSTARLTEKTVTVDSLNIHYLDSLNGEPLVLIHGFGANKDHWTAVARYLTGHYRVVAPDLAGFGESTKNFNLDYTIKAQTERVHDFVEALKLGPIHLGGNSMGGSIAGMYAYLYPDEVKSLWLLDPSGVTTRESSEYFKILEKGEKNPLITETPEEMASMLDFVFYKRPYTPSSIITLLAEKAKENRMIKDVVFQSIIHETLRLDGLLKDSPIPTLVMWGKNDRILHIEGAGVLCSVMPAAQCVILDKTGHLPMLEKPKESAEAFLAFQKSRH